MKTPLNIQKSLYKSNRLHMGNKISLATHKVFEKDLDYVTRITNAILTDKNVFKNPNYNFLSKDVCEKHTLVLEDELKKQLKVSLQTVGTSLYLIPNNDSTTKTVIKGTQLTKKELCEKISNHYMKLLYILSLIKYVYDIEHHGDYSIAGIIFRNIRIVDDIMAINYCSMPQKDYSQKTQNMKIDFGQLEGMMFFVDYVLTQSESKVFVDVLKALLSRSPRGVVRQHVCGMLKGKSIRPSDLQHVKQLYQEKYKMKLECPNDSSSGKLEKGPASGVSLTHHEAPKRPNLFMRIEKDNPVFLKEYCYNVKEIVIPMTAPNSTVVVESFKTMQSNYKNNIKAIERLLDRIVVKKSETYVLKDVTKFELDEIINDVKSCVQVFYMQSIADYQHMLDTAKNNQNIQVNKE